MKTSLVSYGALHPSFVGSLQVVFGALFEGAERAELPACLRPIEDLIKFSDSGVWGEESLDPSVDMRVFRVSDFERDFSLDYHSPPYRTIPLKNQQKYQLSDGDILVVKSSGSARQVVSGRVAVFEEQPGQRFAASNFLLRLRPNKDIIDPQYLAFALGSPVIREWIAESVKTMTYPNLPFKLYRQIEVPVIPRQDQTSVAEFMYALLNGEPLPKLPQYLHEQRRIVSRIDKLAAKVEEARGLRQQAVQEAKAVVESARHQSIFTTARHRYGTRDFNDAVGSIRGPKSGLQRKHYQETGRFPVVDQGQQLVGGYTDDERYVITVTSPVVVWGDHTTNVKLVDFDFVQGADGTKVFKPVQQFDPAYVAHYLRGVDYPDLGYSRHYRYLKDQEIPEPPLAEQRRIVAYLDDLQAKVDALERLEEQTAAELDALLPSILDKAFKGELV